MSPLLVVFTSPKEFLRLPLDKSICLIASESSTHFFVAPNAFCVKMRLLLFTCWNVAWHLCTRALQWALVRACYFDVDLSVVVSVSPSVILIRVAVEQ